MSSRYHAEMMLVVKVGKKKCLLILKSADFSTVEEVQDHAEVLCDSGIAISYRVFRVNEAGVTFYTPYGKLVGWGMHREKPYLHEYLSTMKIEGTVQLAVKE